jgi:succinyl-CoA synthetase beta subunit
MRKSCLHGQTLLSVASVAFPCIRHIAARDCTLVEINPLGIVGGKAVALDAKISIDDDAMYRQNRFGHEEL